MHRPLLVSAIAHQRLHPTLIKPMLAAQAGSTFAQKCRASSGDIVGLGADGGGFSVSCGHIAAATEAGCWCCTGSRAALGRCG
jgi:hypothetical protein